MRKVGRNDPCPCGSGRKYKKCCQASADDSDFQYRRWRRVEADLIPQLISYAIGTLGPDAIEDAWQEFHDDSPDDVYDPASSMNMVFMPWFLFNWTHDVIPPGANEFIETTIAESFLSEVRVTDDQEKLLVSAIRRPYSLCEVAEVNPGVGMTLFDLLRRTRFEVVERAASQSLKRGEIIFCATTQLAGISSNMGTSPYALRPTAKRDVLELRKWMLQETESKQITDDHLHMFEGDIRGLYLDIVAAMFKPPQLTNTDKDPLLPQTLYFELASADQAFHALKDLAEGVPESELSTEVTPEGVIEKAEISWLGGTDEARKRLGGPVLLATIKIENCKLRVNVNSNRRAETIRSLIEERLGNQVTYQRTVFEPVESDLEKMWQAGGRTTRAGGSPTLGICEADWDESEVSEAEWAERTEESGVISREGAPPELIMKLEETARQTWIAWLDLIVPALNDLTPREAAKTEEGRDLLESLLLYYENQEEAEEDTLNNLMRPDIPALRRELGLPDTRG
ncbi:MAG TPA: SEC-C metal-binding domain-containing protein [Pyrinomonadaceae bacterium]|nr:SEC-C metal-binding domain-containing protein [Pyrinomonadaceae bacterium]